ncbi:MAG: hypothetical protein QXH20_02150 [Candidatus Bathyarchaeia archaeon]
MYTTVAYFQSLPPNSPPTPITPVPDPHVRVEGANIIVPEGMNFYLGARLIAVDYSVARLDAPSLRRFMYHWFAEVSGSTTTDLTVPFDERFYSPLPLDNFEPLRVVVDNINPTQSRNRIAVVFIGDGPQTPVTGDIYTVKATGSGTIKAMSWSNVSLSFTDTIPAGRYQLVGASIADDNMVAIRFVFVGQSWRPGVLGRSAFSAPEHNIFRHGRIGVLGEFPHDQPPTVDVLAGVDMSSITVFLDLIKVG